MASKVGKISWSVLKDALYFVIKQTGTVKLKPKIYIGFIFFLLSAPLWAQTKKDEVKLAKEALAFFDARQYVDAFPLYSQLVALNPSNADYAYFFGVCATFCDVDKTNAVKYLKQAIKGNYAAPEVYYFLGRALHLSYQFGEACNAYETFLDVASPEVIRKYDAMRQIQMCIYGAKLLANPKELMVKKRTEAERINFFRYMQLEAVGGKIITTPNELLQGRDKKSTNPHLIYLNGTPKNIYFSMLTDTAGLDLFQAELKSDGTYGVPTPVSGKINTNYDEDYAFLHPSGRSLYFASKGHNSMGGYDIFRSDLDSLTKKWKKPVNLGFAFNTPDDDLFFISDADNKTAIFASGRTSDLNHYSLYQTAFEGTPIDIIYAKAKFANLNNPENNVAQIVVKDLETGEIVGEVTADVKTGAFDVYFPKPGRYSYSVTLPEGTEQLLAEFDVQPGRSGSVYFPQQVNVSKDDKGADVITVKNGQDMTLDRGMEKAVSALLRSKSQLPVSKQAEDMANMERSMTNAPALAGFSKGKTAEDILNDMKAEAKALSAAQPIVQKQKQAAYQLANQQMKLSQSTLAKSDSLIKTVSDKVDAAKAKGNPYIFTDADREVLNQAQQLREESEAHRLKARGSMELADQLNAYQATLEPTSKELLTRSTKLQSYLKDNNVEGAIDVMTEERKRLLAEQSRPKKPGTALPQNAKSTTRSHQANEDLYANTLRELNTAEAKAIADQKANAPSLAQSQAAAKNKKTELLQLDPKVKKTFDDAASAKLANGIYTQMNNNESLGLSEAEKVNMDPAAVAQLQSQLKAMETKSNSAFASQPVYDLAKVSPYRNYSINDIQDPGASGAKAAGGNEGLAVNAEVKTPENGAQSGSEKKMTDNGSNATTKVDVTVPADSAGKKNSLEVKTTVSPEGGKVETTVKADESGKGENKSSKTAGDPSLTEEENKDLELALKSSKIMKQIIDSAGFKEYDAMYAYEELKAMDRLKKYPDLTSLFKERAKLDSINQVIAQAELNIKKETDPAKKQSLVNAQTQQIAQRSAIELKNKEVFRGLARNEVEASKGPAMKRYEESLADLKNEPILSAFINQLKNDIDSVSDLAVIDRKKADVATTDAEKAKALRSAFAKELMVADMYAHMKKALDAMAIFALYSTADEAFLLSNDEAAIRAKYSTHSVKIDVPTDTIADTGNPENNNPNKNDAEAVNADIMRDLQSLTFSDEQMKKNGIKLTQESYTKENVSDLFMPKAERVDKPFFVKMNKSAYGAQNPIPVDEQMPMGIVYTVQVGAFRNPIPNNTFNEFAPVMGQKLNNGFTRYMAGLFPDKKSAIQARNEIRMMGYSDAFVVVYKDGKRVGMNSVPASPNIEKDNTAITQPIPPKSTNASGAKTIAARNVADEEGFFTIQVGVFGRPALEGEISIGNLNMEYDAGKNLYRYSTGIYYKKSEAQAALPGVKAKGFEDAFITAYKKGKKVSVTDLGANDFQPKAQPKPVEQPTEKTAPTVDKNNQTEPVKTEKKTTVKGAEDLNKDWDESDPNKIFYFRLEDVYGTYKCCESSDSICNNPDNRNAIKRLTLISNGSGVAIDGNNKTTNFKWKYVKNDPMPIQEMESILGPNYSFYYRNGNIHLGDFCKPKDE
jgi:hypothetical protein